MNSLDTKWGKLTCLLLVFTAACIYAEPPASPDWRQALPGAKYDFPTDHAIHADFKTEWWYFTGTLRTPSGKDYGYELTFFRQGVLPPDTQASRDSIEPGARSQFVQNDFKFAHFAISDLSGHRFHFAQKINRGAFGEAGFGQPLEEQAAVSSRVTARLAWIDNWSLQTKSDGSWRIRAKTDSPTSMSIDLDVTPLKALVIEGIDGVSQKAASPGDASYYYSYTRLKTSGTLSVADGVSQPVTGESWFDHEWASNQLAADQVGWDWFCFQFEDQTELMLYAMRRRDGSVDPVSSGTWVAADGRAEHLKLGEFTLRPARRWRSSQTGATYPVEWQVSVPSHQLDLSVTPRLDEQELILPPLSYWEGAIGITGRQGTHAIRGHGYMELTGYTGPLRGLSGEQNTSDARLHETPR